MMHSKSNPQAARQHSWTLRAAAEQLKLAPAVLVVFADRFAQGHFLLIARRELIRAGVHVPLMASHRRLLERDGPARARMVQARLQSVGSRIQFATNSRPTVPRCRFEHPR